MKRVLIFLACCLVWPQAWAVLTIDITQGAEGALPIAVVPFASVQQGPSLPEDLAGIVHNDLRGSGRFAPMPREHLPEQPVMGQAPNFQVWRTVGMRHLVIGSVSGGMAVPYTVEFELYDVLKGERVTGYSFSTPASDLRRVAHRISDMIYQAILGEPGAFNTRLAFVTVGSGSKGRAYRLQVSDIDGANAQTVLNSPEPLLSPAWSPDGQSLAYVSLEHKRSAVYVQDVRSGQRQQVAAFPGLNSAPAWSPDGTRLALSLSKDGNPEIYVLNLLGRNLQRLTTSPAIDTEPSWSPDGSQIAFTSDRGGGPQIYLMPANGGGAQRLTFEGSYNARPRFSADGKKLALVHGNGNSFQIALLNLENRQLQVLTNAGLDESPTLAPNNSMVIYASGRELAAVSTDGRIRQRLAVDVGEEVREPAWSPLLGQ